MFTIFKMEILSFISYIKLVAQSNIFTFNELLFNTDTVQLQVKGFLNIFVGNFLFLIFNTFYIVDLVQNGFDLSFLFLHEELITLFLALIPILQIFHVIFDIIDLRQF